MLDPKSSREPLSKQDLLVEAAKIREKLQDLLTEVMYLIAQTKKLADDVGQKSQKSQLRSLHVAEFR
jgi:uncharacterized protein YoxC